MWSGTTFQFETIIQSHETPVGRGLANDGLWANRRQGGTAFGRRGFRLPVWMLKHRRLPGHSTLALHDSPSHSKACHPALVCRPAPMAPARCVP